MPSTASEFDPLSFLDTKPVRSSTVVGSRENPVAPGPRRTRCAARAKVGESVGSERVAARRRGIALHGHNRVSRAFRSKRWEVETTRWCAQPAAARPGKARKASRNQQRPPRGGGAPPDFVHPDIGSPGSHSSHDHGQDWGAQTDGRNSAWRPRRSLRRRPRSYRRAPLAIAARGRAETSATRQSPSLRVHYA